MNCGTDPTGSGQRTNSKMLDNARMPIVSRCHQYSVHHLPAIILNRIPRERGHSTIRFLHDQIRRGKIPVAALAACKSGIEAAVRNPAQPKRQRSDPRMQRDLIRRRTQPLHQRLRAGHAGKIKLRAPGRTHRPFVARGALAADREEEFIAGGREYRRQHRRGARD